MSSSRAGAEMITFLAPAARCPAALALSMNRPVDSTTSWTPRSFHGRSAGVRALTTRISRPSTSRTSSSALSGLDFFEPTVPPKRPCTESYLSRYARLSAGTTSPTATTSRSVPKYPWLYSARNTSRPMRPNPLIATRTAIRRPPLSEMLVDELDEPGEAFGPDFGLGLAKEPGALGVVELELHLPAGLAIRVHEAIEVRPWMRKVGRGLHVEDRRHL